MLSDGIYSADHIFTGSTWLQQHALVIQQGIITAVMPMQQLIVPAQQHYPCLIPSFIDVQIYGAKGLLFSQYPNAASLQALYEHCTAAKTDFFMPTVATNTYAVFHACIDAVRAYWQQGGKGCLGLHIEGPWIHPAKKGAHLEACIHTPSIGQVMDLLHYGKDVIKMITLAPEVCTASIVNYIQSQGIIVSAGHSNANYAQAMQAFQQIHTCTHLYNAMSGLQHRNPGMVEAIFNHPTVMASIIPDGHHVSFPAIQIAFKQMQDRLFVITDAVTNTTEGPYQHVFAADKYTHQQILSGSSLTMPEAVHRLVQQAQISLDAALNMCSLHVAKAIHMQDQLGKIEVGYLAAITDWTL